MMVAVVLARTVDDKAASEAYARCIGKAGSFRSLTGFAQTLTAREQTA
jgi:hypothetical protein